MIMSKNDATYHTPVMRDESVEALRIKPDGIYVDATFGGGGHSKAILRKLGPEGRLLAFDRDEDTAAHRIDDPRFTLIHADYAYLKNYLRAYGIREIDGLLADLGVSSHQFDTAERGFSTRFEGPLDMRMDRSQEKTAAQILNEYDEGELARIFSQYGELRNARAVARSIIRYRKNQPLETTTDLLEAIQSHIPAKRRNKWLAQIFQALRIEVNGELESLKRLLRQAAEVIKPGGRLAVITYHSLEDRLVKRFIRSGNFDDRIEKDFYGHMHTPFRKTGKFRVPSPEEIERNPRARSAKLRVAERTDEPYKGEK